jgi:hypothetical protein
MPSQYDWLTSQEKLALAMTTAGSMRGLASFMGITHQKLGRWLREGHTGGVKRIPDDSETIALIDSVFEAHRDISRAEAQASGIPFDEETPVFAKRKLLRKTDEFGEQVLGDRVFVEHTQFIRSDLRQAIFYGIHQTEQYYTANVRSVIDLAHYLNLSDERIGRKRTDTQRMHLASLLLAQADEEEYRPIFTPVENFRRGSSAIRAVKSIEASIRQRHEPATSDDDKNTSLADQYLMQLIPRSYVEPAKQARAKRAAQRRAKPKGGRGPK